MSTIADLNDHEEVDTLDTDVEQPADPKAEQRELALVSAKMKLIKADKEFHKKAFEQMQKDMFMAFHGRDATYSESNYKANIAGRHVKQKTAALYAKNPVATAAREERMDFEVWDESPKSLMMAFQITQMAQQALQMLIERETALVPELPSREQLLAPDNIHTA